MRGPFGDFTHDPRRQGKEKCFFFCFFLFFFNGLIMRNTIRYSKNQIEQEVFNYCTFK